mgnify:CR=1 FL=1
MSSLVIPEGYTLRTAHADIYAELVDDKKLFKRSIHLFTVALAVGAILNIKSDQKKRDHDLIRLSTVTDQEQRLVIDILSRIVCKEPDKIARGRELLAYADGGLEKIWKDYQEVGVLDLPRLLEKLKGKCSLRIAELLTQNQPW